VGTGSPRRSCQLKALRADLVTRDLRGNLDTRLAKLRAGEYDAILLARAGLRRLGIEVEGSVLDHEQMIPAPGQGAMAIEIRSDDRGLQNVLRRHHDESSAAAVTAERALLRALGGGCRAPIAAFGRVTEGTLDLLALVATPSGGSIVKDRRTGDARDPESVGLGLADALLARGAAALLGESAAPPAEEP